MLCSRREWGSLRMALKNTKQNNPLAAVYRTIVQGNAPSGQVFLRWGAVMLGADLTQGAGATINKVINSFGMGAPDGLCKCLPSWSAQGCAFGRPVPATPLLKCSHFWVGCGNG